MFMINLYNDYLIKEPWGINLHFLLYYCETRMSISIISDMVGQTNINNCRVSLYQSKKIVSKFVAKYRILFKDILTFLGLDNRYASLITLYLVVVGITKMFKINKNGPTINV